MTTPMRSLLEDSGAMFGIEAITDNAVHKFCFMYTMDRMLVMRCGHVNPCKDVQSKVLNVQESIANGIVLTAIKDRGPLDKVGGDRSL